MCVCVCVWRSQWLKRRSQCYQNLLKYIVKHGKVLFIFCMCAFKWLRSQWPNRRSQWSRRGPNDPTHMVPMIQTWSQLSKVPMIHGPNDPLFVPVEYKKCSKVKRKGKTSHYRNYLRREKNLIFENKCNKCIIQWYLYMYRIICLHASL